MSTIARFERSGEAQLSHVIRIAIALDAETGFTTLFPAPELRSLDEILKSETPRKRVRPKQRRRAK